MAKKSHEYRSICGRWKVKCKKLEKQLALFRHSAEQSSGRSEQLLSELQASRQQAALATQQVEHLKRAFNTLLVSVGMRGGVW